MQVKRVREQQAYSYDEVSKYLDDVSINRLIALNMVRKINVGDKFGVNDLQCEEDVDFGALEGQVCIVYRFVGMLVVNGMCLLSYPKYCQKIDEGYDQTYELFREIIQVIRKYNSLEQKQAQAFEMATDDVEDFNLLAFTLVLLQDYYEHGLYCAPQNLVELNGQGGILWEKTIAEQNVFISNDSYIYLDFFTEKSEEAKDNFVRKVHAAVITQCCQTLSAVLEILGDESIYISGPTLEELGDDDYILYRLQQEYRSQFETHKQYLIRLLMDYVEQQSKTARHDDLTFVATTSMNMVWEKACAVQLGDCRKKRLSELGLLYADSNGNSAGDLYVEDIMPRPQWMYLDGTTHIVKDTLILDTIVINESGIEIYDAKYYNIQFNKTTIKGQPGVGDITKQYLYEKAYQGLAQENGLAITKNAFLFPTEGEEEICLGEVTIDLFDDSCHGISIVLKPVRQVYQAFLKA